jgi:hypothetical protein
VGFVRLKYIVYFTLICSISFSFLSCSSSKEKDIFKKIDGFYQKISPSNKGVTEIYSIKEFQDGNVVLTEKYPGDGESGTVLFLLDKNNKVLKRASGENPMTPCFVVNVAKLGNANILFGKFKDSMWSAELNKKVNVKIDKIKVEFQNGDIIEENVSTKKGYIIISKSKSDIKSMELYNNNNVLQSNLNDIKPYGDLYNYTEFYNTD